MFTDITIQHAHPATILLIVGCYIVFAVQVAWQCRWHRVRQKDATAVIALVFVFIFCSMSGYASTLLPEKWQWLRDPFHWALAGFSLVLVTSNKAKIISRLLDRDDG